jgi:hypothetical protein
MFFSGSSIHRTWEIYMTQKPVPIAITTMKPPASWKELLLHAVVASPATHLPLLLCMFESMRESATSQHAQPSSNAGGGAKSHAIQRAIDELWPNGIPKELSAKDRDNKINSKMKEYGSSSSAHPRTIQRVLKKRHSRIATIF